MRRRPTPAEHALLAALLAALPAGCAHLPRERAERAGITEAQAVQVFQAGALSALRTSSYIFGARPAADIDAQPLPVAGASRVPVRVSASRHLRDAGVDGDDATDVAGLLAAVVEALPGYLARPAPVRAFEVLLVAPAETFAMHRWSVSAARRHAVAFAVAWPPDDRGRARRETVDTFAHELLHVDLGANGRAVAAEPLEEPAAYALGVCIELEVFGSVAAPAGHDAPADGFAAGLVRSMDAGRADPELSAAFAGRARLDTGDPGADVLRTLCRDRVRAVQKPRD